MIKCLMIYEQVPYPLEDGMNIRFFNLFRLLRQKLDITLVCRSLSPLSEKQNAILSGGDLARIEAIYEPPPDAINKICKALSFVITPSPLMAAGIYFTSVENRIKALVAQNQFDIVQIDGLFTGIYSRALKHSHSKKVLSLPDVGWQSLWRQCRSMSPGIKKAIYFHDALKARYWEPVLCDDFDRVVVVSELDRNTMLARRPDLRITVVPNGVDCDSILPFPDTKSSEILFVGSMNYYPNESAVIYFLKEILPIIRNAIPRVRVWIVGKDPSAAVRKLGNEMNITITGRVDDVAPYYERSALSIVPLLAGGGTRLKILESMAFGRPVVSTPLGAEGIKVAPGENILIAQGPKDFANSVIRLLSDMELRKKLAFNGRRLVEKQYSWPTLVERLYNMYEDLLREQ